VERGAALRVSVDRRLGRFLRRRGATRVEVDAASAEQMLTLLVLDRILVPGRPYLTADDVATRSGIDRATTERLWRALGFPDVEDGTPAFTEESVDVVRLLTEQRDTVLLESDDDALVAEVRAVATGLGRVAETISDQVVETVRAAQAGGVDDQTIAGVLADTFDWQSLARLTDYALRVQVRAAVWRKLLNPQVASGEVPSFAVGFLDLVGYTALSQELDEEELAALVARFETLTHDTIAQLGARVVKTIGDEVMFVAEDPAVAVQVALALTDRTRQDEVLPRARAGLAFGPVLAREGDYYGSVVNLAHRLVEIARPASVVVSADVAAALDGRAEFGFGRLRSRRIRDIGRVEIFAVTPTDGAAAPLAD
jgi:adenylate cyclase